MSEIAQQVREAAAHRLLFLPHAVRQMARPDRMISVAEVRHCVTEGSVIEDYPEDARGHSCLMLGEGAGGRPLHVVCSPKNNYLAIITAYQPSPAEWHENWRTRKASL